MSAIASGAYVRPTFGPVTPPDLRSEDTSERMDTTLAIIAVLVLVASAVLVGYLFFWAAVKDGEHDDATQRRLRLRRRTRLGPD